MEINEVEKSFFDDLSNAINVGSDFLSESFIKKIVNGYVEEISFSRRKLFPFDKFERIEQELIEGKLKHFKYDFSRFKNLKHLHISNFGIKDIKVNSNSKLKYLNLRGNDIHQLEIADLSQLEYLDISENRIKGKVNLASFEFLEKLNIRDNKFNQIVLPLNSNLIELDVGQNFITKLDLQNQKKLKVLNCFHNLLYGELDLSNQQSIEKIWCSSQNGVNAIKLADSAPILELICSNLELTRLEISNYNSLKTVFCSGNKLSNLDLSNKPNLQSLKCEENNIKKLDIRDCSALMKLLYDQSKCLTVECTSLQKLVIEDLRKKFKPDDPFNITKTMKLHRKACDFNWDYGVSGLKSLVKSKRCDQGTALMLFWLGLPEDYYFPIDNIKYTSLSQWNQEHYDFLKDLEKRIISGYYESNLIPFDPENFEGRDLLKTMNKTEILRKKIHQILLTKSTLINPYENKAATNRVDGQ